MKASVDTAVAEWVAGHRTDWITRLCRFLEQVGESPALFVVPSVVAAVALVVLQLWRDVPRVALGLFLTVAVTGTMKGRLDRSRPPADLAATTLAGPSMPSSHAVLCSALLVVTIMIVPWSSNRVRLVVGLLGGLGCVIIGAAMIYLGGHWLSDVVVGWSLAALLTGVTLALCDRAGLSGRRSSS